MRLQCAAPRVKESNAAAKLSLATKQSWTQFSRPVTLWLKQPKKGKVARRPLALPPTPRTERSRRLPRSSPRSAGLPGFRNAARVYVTQVHRFVPGYFDRLPTDWD